MKKDQRKVEDTAAANRPSEVENDFAEFFDGERMDAIEKMQKVFGSEEVNDISISYPRLACIIFEVRRIDQMCFSIFNSLKAAIFSMFPNIPEHPLSKPSNHTTIIICDVFP